MINHILSCFLRYRNLEDYVTFMHHVIELHLSVTPSSTSLVLAYAQSLIKLLNYRNTDDPQGVVSGQGTFIQSLSVNLSTWSKSTNTSQELNACSKELRNLLFLSYQYQYRSVLSTILTYYANTSPSVYIEYTSVLMNCIAGVSRFTRTHLDFICHLTNWVEQDMVAWRNNGSIIRIASAFHITVPLDSYLHYIE